MNEYRWILWTANNEMSKYTLICAFFNVNLGLFRSPSAFWFRVTLTLITFCELTLTLQLD